MGTNHEMYGRSDSQLSTVTSEEHMVEETCEETVQVSQHETTHKRVHKQVVTKTSEHRSPTPPPASRLNKWMCWDVDSFSRIYGGNELVAVNLGRWVHGHQCMQSYFSQLMWCSIATTTKLHPFVVDRSFEQVPACHNWSTPLGCSTRLIEINENDAHHSPIWRSKLIILRRIPNTKTCFKSAIRCPPSNFEDVTQTWSVLLCQILLVCRHHCLV